MLQFNQEIKQLANVPSYISAVRFLLISHCRIARGHTTYMNESVSLEKFYGYCENPNLFSTTNELQWVTYIPWLFVISCAELQQIAKYQIAEKFEGENISEYNFLDYLREHNLAIDHQFAVFSHQNLLLPKFSTTQYQSPTSLPSLGSPVQNNQKPDTCWFLNFLRIYVRNLTCKFYCGFYVHSLFKFS